MAEYPPLEEILEVHPLDEVGRHINRLLQAGNPETTQSVEMLHGTTHTRRIDVGEVSFFFARQDPAHRFVMGFDRIRDGEYLPLSDEGDYIWDIHSPEEALFTQDQTRKLQDILKVLLSLGA